MTPWISSHNLLTTLVDRRVMEEIMAKEGVDLIVPVRDDDVEFWGAWRDRNRSGPVRPRRVTASLHLRALAYGPW